MWHQIFYFHREELCSEEAHAQISKNPSIKAISHTGTLSIWKVLYKNASRLIANKGFFSYNQLSLNQMNGRMETRSEN